MKYRNNAALGLAVLALCVILLVTLVQAFGATPLQTASRPLASPIEPVIPTVDVALTADAERLRLVATLSAEATATTEARPPRPTPGAIVGPKQIYDPFNQLILELPESWYAVVPINTTGTVAAVTSISSYDFYNTKTLSDVPVDGVSLDIFTGAIPSGRSFNDWVAEQHKLATTPQEGASQAFAVSVTDVTPYDTLVYKGLAFDEIALDQVRWRVIYLNADNARYISISIRPINAVTQNNVDVAIKLLDTLKIQPQTQ